MSAVNLDDLELELRKLPGVRAAGFTDRDDMLVVQVQVSGDDPSPGLSQQAARIAYRHADKPVALEVVRWRTAAPAPAVAVEAGGAAAASARTADRRSARRECRPRPRRRAKPPPTPTTSGKVHASACSRCSRSPTPTSSRCTSPSLAGA